MSAFPHHFADGVVLDSFQAGQSETGPVYDFATSTPLATREETRQFVALADELAQQRPDAETQEFLSYLYTQPKVRLILAGHTHWDSETVLPGGIRQLVSAGTFFGTAREITLV